MEGLCQTCGRIIYGVTKKGLIITEICSGVFDFSVEQMVTAAEIGYGSPTCEPLLTYGSYHVTCIFVSKG